MSNGETQPATTWVIHTPLGFYRCYDHSVHSVTFTQDARLAQSWVNKDHAESYIACTTLAGIPTTVMDRTSAQDFQEMGIPAKMRRAALDALALRTGGT